MRKPALLPHGSAWVADNATVVGEVSLAAEVSVWYGCVVRADVASITIGARTNVQDLSCIHPQHDEPMSIGEEVVIGHGVLVHNRVVGDRCLLGMGSILMPGVRVGSDCLVAAGALLPPGMEVPDGQLVRGSPARIVRELTREERTMIAETMQRYLDLCQRHRA